MRDQRKAHERWCRHLPPHTAWLVEQLHARIVPEFERRGFVRYPDYAGGDSSQIGPNSIPLQRRSGTDWATAEIRLDEQGAPWFVVEFGLLPPVCKRPAARAPYDLVDVPREAAVLVDAPEYFMLARGERRSLDCEFGYRWFSLRPRRFLGKELDKAVSLLPEAFRLLDGDVPRERLAAATWPVGKVTDHVVLAGGRRVEQERLPAPGAAAPPEGEPEAEGDAVDDAKARKALAADLEAVSKRGDRRLLVGLALLVPLAFAFDRAGRKSAWIALAGVAGVVGLIAFTLVSVSRGKRGLAEKYSLVCPACGARPSVQVMESAPRHCMKCRARLPGWPRAVVSRD